MIAPLVSQDRSAVEDYSVPNVVRLDEGPRAILVPPVNEAGTTVELLRRRIAQMCDVPGEAVCRCQSQKYQVKIGTIYARP